MNIAAGGALVLVAVLGLGYWSLLPIPAGVNGDNILVLVVGLVSAIVGGGLLSGHS